MVIMLREVSFHNSLIYLNSSYSTTSLSDLSHNIVPTLYALSLILQP